jgi:hypothetical protein
MATTIIQPTTSTRSYAIVGEFRPISFSGGVKSISDDDLCATCSKCRHEPGGNSSCTDSFPGQEDADGYVQDCHEFDPRKGA